MAGDGFVATLDVFSDDEMARLRSFPKIGRPELIQRSTLTDADEASLREFQTGRNVLGAAVQLSALPYLGYVPDDASATPAAALGRLPAPRRAAGRAARLRRLQPYPYQSPAGDCRVRGVAHDRCRRV